MDGGEGATAIPGALANTPQLLRLLKIAKLLKMLKLLRVVKIKRILMKFEEYEQATGRFCPYLMKAERIEYENKRIYAVFELMEYSLT